MKQIKVGAVLSYISIFLTFIVGIIYTPILIRWLGQTDYGIYSLVISLVAYLSLLDMGIGNAIVRYISRNKKIGNKERESDLIGQFFTFFSIIGLITLIIGGILSLNVSNIFSNSLENEQINIVKTMIIVLTINFALSFPLNVFSAVLQAYEQFIFLKTLNIIRTLLVPIMTLVALFLGGHLVAITLVTTFVNLMLLIVSLIFCIVKFKVKVTFNPLDKGMKKEIIVYSSLVFLTAIADKIYWQTDQILLGIMKTPEAVAIYAVAIQLIMIFGTLSTSISSLFLPMVSQLVTQDNHMKKLNSIYINISRIQCYILALTFSGFILFGQEFISLWAGSNFREAYWIVIILMIPFFFDLISNIGLAILQAKGLNLFRALSLLICSILNILISIPIIETYGSIGTAIVSAIFIGLGNVILLNIYYKFKVKLDVLSYWKNILGIIVPVSLLAIFYKLGDYLGYFTFHLIIDILVYSLLYVTLLYIIVINKNEKNKIKKIFS